jgi:hypothetical protein
MEVKGMSKTNAATKQQQESAFELMRGGQLPKDVVQRHFSEMKQKLAEEIKEKSAIQQQAAKYFSEIQKPLANVAGDSAAVAGLGRITDQLAKQKLVVPAIAKVAPGILAGSYTLRFAPPYTAYGNDTVSGDSYPVSGNPTVSTSAVPSLGQFNSSVATDFKSPSEGYAESLMGVHFRPMFGPATARIWFDSEIAFSWWVNSIGPQAMSEAHGLLQLYQYDGAFTFLTEREFTGWRETAQNQLNFDFGSTPGPTWYLESPVSPSHFYFVTMRLRCRASGAGWPGSLAGANLSITVPSITVEVTMNPIVLGA